MGAYKAKTKLGQDQIPVANGTSVGWKKKKRSAEIENALLERYDSNQFRAIPAMAVNQNIMVNSVKCRTEVEQ